MAEARAPNSEFGSLSAGPEPSWRDHLTDLLARVYGGGKGGQAQARQAVGLADFLPGTGTGLAIDDTARSLGEGNYGEAALNSLGLVPEAGPMLKASIIGLMAKLPDKERGLQKLAEVMSANGSNRDEVFNKTGWFQQHGDWKTEISDKDADFTESAMEKLLGKEGRYKGYLGPDRQPDLFTGKEGEGLYDHPELFDLYPDLENMPVDVQMNYRGRSGGFHPDEGISVEGTSTSDARDVLTHEIQHAIQTQEGFAKGGNPSDRSLMKPMQKVKKGAEGRVTELMDEREAFIKQRQAAGDPRNPTQLAKVWQTSNPEKAKEFDAVIGTSLGPAGPTAGYHHLAGETEARNVAKRRDMDQMELFQKPPWQTQDLPDSLQIPRRRAGRDDLVQAMARQPAAAPGTKGLKAAEPLTGGRISQRFPTGKTDEDPLTENLLINTDVLRQDPKKMEQTADVIRAYPSTTNEMKEMGSDEMVNAFIEQLRGNYNAMYDMMPPEAAERAGKWYLGANRIAGERAHEVGVSPEASAGVYAALSPQKDWFMNVYLGDQVLRTLDRNPKVTKDMLRVAEGIKPFQTDEARDMLAASMGRRILNLDPEAQAAAVRLYDETYNPRTYQKITPEGDYGDFMTTKAGELAKPAWNTQNAIEKAVQSAQSGGDMSVISPLMGNKHKVRNFYNNIAAPELGASFGDITADTHHIGAGLFRPLTGNSPEVLQGLLSGSAGIAKGPQSATTGLQGLYPLYADATRLAAADRGIPTRQMQSVPWEAMRALFPPEFRTAANQSKIDDFWRLFGQGEIDADEARRRTVEAAGGFTPPSW